MSKPAKNASDPRLDRLDPSDPFYDLVVQILVDHPRLSPEKLQKMGEIQGFTVRLKDSPKN